MRKGEVIWRWVMRDNDERDSGRWKRVIVAMKSKDHKVIAC
jgi:hypothetical protein